MLRSGEQRFHRQYLPRSAEPTLHGVMSDERFLHRIEAAARGQALDSSDVSTLALDRQQKTAIEGFAVQKNGAGAAISHLAARFGAGQMEIPAQNGE